MIRGVGAVNSRNTHRSPPADASKSPLGPVRAGVAQLCDQLSIWLYNIFLSVNERPSFLGRMSSVVIRASLNHNDPEQNG
ncbi:protein of unknown function [Methylorubrum extorquens]|uniref:Uncharacterized protein n=1 Tax=Methylorubrum extorquens TaxID=408 RepID=A0A2N9AZ13_METEX|nr:protein of unknown function [Methylorubrum extorquens]